MKHLTVPRIQIGKAGITPGFIQSLISTLKTHRKIKISVLKSAGHDKQKVKDMAKELETKLPGIRTKTIGFVITLMKSKFKI